MTKLNLGCSIYKFFDFINIDSDPNVQPDMLLDLKDLTTKFAPESVDFINAGHVLEHIPYEASLKLLNDCCTILKPFASMLVIVPNYEIAAKLLPWKEAERVIISDGEHKQIFNDQKLYDLFKQSKFSYFYNIGLDNIPYMIVSNNLDPKPDPWQSTMLAIKY